MSKTNSFKIDNPNKVNQNNNDGVQLKSSINTNIQRKSSVKLESLNNKLT